jgi:hypothetical protein
VAILAGLIAQIRVTIVYAKSWRTATGPASPDQTVDACDGPSTIARGSSARVVGAESASANAQAASAVPTTARSAPRLARHRAR